MEISSKSTVKELKKYIREATARINMTIREYRESGKKIPRAYEKQIQRLQRLSGVKKPRRGEIGVGVDRKRKAELLRQAGALKSFEAYDTFSPHAIRKAERKYRKSYEVFTQNYGDISFEKWEQLVDIYGTLDSAIVNIYGSEQIKEIVQTEVDDTISANDVERILLDTYNSALSDKARAYTPENLLSIASAKISNLRMARKGL